MNYFILLKRQWELNIDKLDEDWKMTEDWNK